MKKILLFLFAVTLMAAWTAPALAADVTFSGDYEVRAFSTENDGGGGASFLGAVLGTMAPLGETMGVCSPGLVSGDRPFNDDCPDPSSWIDQQFHLGIDARAHDNLTGFVGLRIGSIYGPEGDEYVWGDGIGSGPVDSVTVEEAYIDFNAGPVNVRAGRQEYGPAGDNFHLVMIDELDAFTASTKAGVADIYGAFIKNSEMDWTGHANDDDTNVYVLGAQASPNEGTSVGAFWAHYRDNSSSQIALNWLGASGAFKAGMVDISAEGVLLTGETDMGITGTDDFDFSGYALVAEASAAINQIGLGLVAGISSGDDEWDDSSDPAGIDRDVEQFFGVPEGLGLTTLIATGSPLGVVTQASFNKTDIVFDGGEEGNGGVWGGGLNDLGGITILSPYVSFKVNDQLNLKAIYAWMQFTDIDEDYIEDDSFGSEIDLVANYEIVPQLDLTAQAAWFFPGDGLTDDGDPLTDDPDDTVSEYMLRLKYIF